MNRNIITNWERLPVVLDLNTVAVIFGVTPATVKNLLYRQEIKAQKIGKQWRFDRAYIRNLIEAGPEREVIG